MQTGSDVDYLGAQGYWVCTAVAVLACVVGFLSGQPITGVVALLFYYLSGVGVRQRSRYAATVVLVLYVVDTLLSGVGVLRVILCALLLSNARATWISAEWKPESEEAKLPPRLGETFNDKFVDTLPEWLWPKLTIPYYTLTFGVLVVATAGVIVMVIRHH